VCPLNRGKFSLTLTWAAQGAIGGVVFSLLLATDKRRALSQLSLKRVAMWGVFGALSVPLPLALPSIVLGDGRVLWSVPVYFAQLAIAGAVCAVCAVVVARRAQPSPLEAPDRDLELLIAEGAWPAQPSVSHSLLRVDK